MKKSLYLILILGIAMLMASWSFSGQKLFDRTASTATAKNDANQASIVEPKAEIKAADNEKSDPKPAFAPGEMQAVENAVSEPAETKWQPIYGEKGEILNAEPSVNLMGWSESPAEPPVITTTVFLEDFEAWDTTTTAPTGWLMADNGTSGTQFWWTDDWYKYNYSTWSSNVARFTYLYAAETTYNEWLITPSVALTGGAIACSLTWRNYYDDRTANGGDTAWVKITTDDGVSWTDLAIYDADQASGYKNINITSYAGQTVKVAFVLTAALPAQAYYWYIDNVAIWSDGTQHIYQDFETWGPGGDNPPTGWTILDNGTPKSAGGYNLNDWRSYNHTSWASKTARVYYLTGDTEAQNEWLISPAISLSSGSLCTLSVAQYYYHSTTGAPWENTDHGYILISTDGGATWVDTVQNLTASTGSSTTKTIYKFDISNRAGQTIKIALNFVNGPASFDYWYVDDVKVDETVLLAHDVTTRSIKYPRYGVVGYSAPVKTQVANFGTNTETFQDSFKVEIVNKNVLFYEEFSDPQLWNGASPPQNVLGSWSIIDSGSVPGTWNNNDWHAYYHSSWGDTIARVYYSPIEYQNEWLISPSINCASASNVQLTMRIYYDDYTSDLTDSGWVLGTADDWATTQVIALYTGADYGSISTPAIPTYNISSWAAGQSNVKIAFKYKGYNALYCMYLDKVQVYEELPTTSVYSNGQTVSGLTSLEYRDVDFANWNILSSGEYRLRTFTALATDQNLSNDTVSATFFTLPHTSSGGPDAGYYIWEDNLGLGPAYNWIDISGIGTPIAFPGTGDDRFTRLGIGFTFNYYGNAYDRISVSENGFASFDSLISGYLTNSALPATGLPNNTLAMLWDDMMQGPDANIYYYTNNVDTFIISFLNFKWYATADSANRFDAQMIITGNEKIKYQYRSVGPSIPTGHTIGIENSDGTIGLQYFYNGAPAGNLALPGLAITFSYVPPSHDMAATKLISPGGAMETNTYFTPRASFTNFGNTTETNVPVHFRIYDSGGVQVFSSTKYIASISALEVDTVDFDSTFMATSGTYYCTTLVALPGDATPGNDWKARTMTVFDDLLDFESTSGGLTATGSWGDFSGDWEWGIPTFGPSGANSGVRCWATILDGNRTTGYPLGGIRSWLDFSLNLNSNAAFGFYHWRRASGSTYDSLNIKIDPGTGWVLLASWYGMDTTWQYYSVDLSAYSGIVPFRFEYYSNSSLDNPGWYIDDFTFTNCSLYIPNHDMSANSILNPSGMVANGSPFTPRAVFGNNGLSTETSVPVHFDIYNSVGAIVYSDTQTIASIASLTIDTVDFDPGTLTVNGAYTCSAWVAIITDSILTNNSRGSSFTVDSHYGTGGPDAGHYRWIDNTVIGGPTYSWIDTTGGGWTRIVTWPNGTTDDGRTNPIYMGFPSGFYFYGSMEDSIVIATNGWLSFTAQTSNYLGNYLPPSSSGPTEGVFLNWDDLDGETTADTGYVYYKYDAANNRFIVSYYDWSYYSSPYNPGDFQVIFDADDSSIVMQYGPATGPRQTDITIGIQDSTRTIGLGYYTDGEPQLNLPYEGLAIKFYPYMPSHDVRVVSLDAPTTIVQGQTLDIIATFKNEGINTETFNVWASDNRGYSNIQTITALPPGATVVDTFPGWTIGYACSSYVLTIATQLGTDVDPNNDTLRTTFVSLPASNYFISYDDGVVNNAWRLTNPDNIIANAFNVPYGNATISAITYKMTNLDNYPTWPDANRDTVIVSIYLDTDINGLPDEPAVYTKRLRTPDRGDLVWNVACDTTIHVDCQIFWAGWTYVDTFHKEGICIDATEDYPAAKWMRLDGVWQPDTFSTINGDNMIHAYIQGDTSAAADIAVASTSLSGSADVGGADTAATTLDNVGDCGLLYTASVVQYSPRPIHGDIPIALNTSPIGSQVDPKTGATEPVYPPVINAQGGPDAFGYRWKDSDEPGGPAYSWVDISTIGTPVTFTNGTLDDGWTNLFAMGMTFNYYGIPYDSVMVSTNGWISFVSQTSSYLSNTSIPATALPNAIVPVYWDDMDARNDGDCYYYFDSANNRFIVSWVTWPHYADTTNKIDFQVILNADGSIKMQYGGGLFSLMSYSIGIENETGTIGLQVAYNQAYLHNSMAILFNRPPQWLTTDLTSGVLAPNDPPLTFHAFMDASALSAGTYTGAILITSNDPDEPVTTVNVSFTVTGGGGECDYVLGDINGDGNRIGGDVTFGVRYFKGVGAVPPDSCYMDSTGTYLYVAGDVNGNCEFRGSDITRLVAFFKGNASLNYCHFFPPPILLAPSPIHIQQGINMVPRDENKSVIRETKTAE